MDWLSIVESGGILITAYLLFLLIKEFKKSIKESKKGKVSGKCNLD
ncbi:hypothetical protein ACM66Z_01765 [Sulfurovum sp. ST-21]|uniref:Uncharacterized protein n=1 Tax=Sulfurovum indicum TaxID=2779528 RepID=A0A7M1S475_9BACT|nr:hypothetical protein [Sulfurovum indicum]QOR62227.1 hypothetical protein IMZ28_01755 [Sulfurovum indicum]